MIESKKLHFSYGKRKKARQLLKDVNLDLKPGCIYGLLGLNGVGKSTFMQLISGLVFPDSGELSVMGFEPKQRHPEFLADVFYLPEQVVLPNMLIARYISIWSGFYPNFDHELLKNCLEEFDIPKGVKLNQMSSGQQKKFLLSYGLACRSKILLLDEPTNGLDIPAKGVFRRLVARSITEEQIYIVATHQVKDLESLIDSIIVIHDQSIVLNDSILSMSERLSVTIESANPDGMDRKNNKLIYCERGLGGYVCLWLGVGDTNSRLDIELLFKGVISNPSVFQSPINEVA